MIDKQKYIQKLKVIYETKTNKTLSDEKALNLFENLVSLVAAIHQPIPKELWNDTTCTSCEELIDYSLLKDPPDKKEFAISGLCKNCQNKTFK